MHEENKSILFDIIIIGAGPAGISCALTAKKHKLNVILIDKGNIVNSIIKFPEQMTFFSTSDQLEIDDIPFTSATFRPTRNEAIRYYQKIISTNQIPFMSNSFVTNIIRGDKNFKIEYLNKETSKHLKSRKVVIATGYYENPNLLNIPGEDLSHVSHYYYEPFSAFGKNVVIVGGKNSAVETALELYRSGAHVTMVHRKNSIKESVKYWILPDIQNRINSGEINILLNSNLTKITLDSVVINTHGEQKTVPADLVYLLTGYHPDVRLMQKSGIKYDIDTLEPMINQETYESNVKGIYLAGSVIAGKNPNKIFIENGRKHGDKIIKHMAGHL